MQDELLIPLREILAIVFRRLTSILCIFFMTVFIAIFMMYYMISPGFGSSATIILNNGSVLTEPLRDSPPDSDLARIVDFKSQQDILVSTRIAAEAVDKIDLGNSRVIGRVELFKMWIGDIKRSVGEAVGIERWTTPWDPRAAAIAAVKDNISTSSPPDSNSIVVTYIAKDPEEARRTLDAVMEAHSEYYYGSIKARANGVVTFLQKEFDEAVAEMNEAGQAILQFKLTGNFDESLPKKGTDGKSSAADLSLIGITDPTRIQQELNLYVMKLEEELRLAKQITNNEQRERLEADIQDRLDYYLDYINRLPLRELELATLNRTYSIANDNYMVLQANLARAKLVAGGQTEDINLIENFELPTAEKTPVSPKKKLIVILSAFMGAVLALAWAFVSEYLDHTIKSVKDVETYLKLRVIGSLRVVS